MFLDRCRPIGKRTKGPPHERMEGEEMNDEGYCDVIRFLGIKDFRMAGCQMTLRCDVGTHLYKLQGTATHFILFRRFCFKFLLPLHLVTLKSPTELHLIL